MRASTLLTHLARCAIAVTVCGVVALGFPTGTAGATPRSGLSAVTLGKADIPAGLLPFISGPGEATAREVTIQPGGTTGWHWHDGPVYGIVRSGTMSHPGSDCKPVIYGPGAFLYEPAGIQNTHRANNLTKSPVILDVVYVLPAGKPFMEDAAAPACDTPAR